MTTTTQSIYVEALWVIALLGATALLREASGELCMHIIASFILKQHFLSGKNLDAILSCSNGGRSLGFASAWRLRRFYRGNQQLQLVCCVPLLCWIIGLPIKLIAVTAVRDSTATAHYFDRSTTLLLGIAWIVTGVLTKAIAVWISYRPENPRRVFQERFARFEALLELFDGLISSKTMAESDNQSDSSEPVGLSISNTPANGLQLKPSGQ
jgi:hypothetical protein